MRILFALLILLAGVALLARGYRFARILIPLWGFIAGLSIGGAIIADMDSAPFLGTVLGILVGLVLGAIFALLAYLYYAAAVVILAAAAGYWAGSSFITLLGFDAGFLSAAVGLLAGIAVAVAAILSNAPKYVLIFLTAMAGAMAVVGGVLLLFNQIPLDSFSYAAVNQALSVSFVWTIVAVASMIAGIVFQVRTTENYTLEAWITGDHTTGYDAGHGVSKV